MKTRSFTQRLFTSLSFLAVQFALVPSAYGADTEEFKLEKFSPQSQKARVELEYFLVDKMESLGSIVGSNKQANKLADNDIVYLKFKQMGVSPGDRFIVFQNRGGISAPGVLFGRIGQQIQVKGNIVVTQVLEDIVEAKIVESKIDILKGDLIGPAMDLSVEIKPQEPMADVRGRVIGSPAGVSLLGAFDFAFLNLGAADGLRKNDRMKVIVSGDGNKNLTKGLPEVTIAELVIVHLDEHVSTAYVISAKDSFELGAHVKSDRKQVRFLEDTLPQSQSGQSTLSPQPQ